MGLSSRRCRGVLALAAWCGMAFAAAAQTLGGEAAELTKEQVLELETALAQLSFDPGKIDGVIDERTHAAIRLYQNFAALPVDAKATPALLVEVLSVARSFAEIRSPQAPDPATDTSSDVALETPAEAPAPRQEPDPPKLAATKPPDEAPSDIPAQAPAEASPPASKPGTASAEAAIAEPKAAPLSDTPGEQPAGPGDDPQQAAEPENAPPRTARMPRADVAEPAKVPEPPKKPEVEASIVGQTPPKPQPAPKGPSPTEDKAAAGYNIGSVISRLVETRKSVDKLTEPGSAAAPDAAPPSGLADSGQLARVPAPVPTPARPTSPARTPGTPVDGYAAFQDAYKAAQAGDLEYAAQRYTDAIESKKLTLEHLGDAHFNRANVLHFLGRYDQSIADFGVTIGAKPNFAGAYYNRGFAHQAKGDRQRAVDDFRRARDLGLQRLGVRAPDRSPPLR